MSLQTGTRDLPTDAVLALNEGRLIDAIRLYRNAHGVGLKEAREAIEEYLELHPPLRARLRAQMARQRRRIVAWLAALGVGLALALALLRV